MAFPTPLESGGLPSWALSIIISAVFISLLWFAALAALIVFEVRRRRRNYLWVPTTPSPQPTTTANKYSSPSRQPSYLSSHLPPPISPHQSLDDHTHSSFAADKKEPLPSYHDIDVPQLDPFEEVEEREFNLRLHRGTSFNSMASSAAGETPITEKKVPQAISFSKQHSQDEATPTNPTPFTRLDTPDSSRSSGRSSGQSSGQSTDSSALSGMVLSRPVTLRQLGATIREPSYLEGEFKKLPNPVFTAEDMPKGTERKNRYSNVLPTPKTRVHLSLLPGRPNSDYINANHIRGYQGAPRQYIATQGPMESTVEDFWRMVWENNTDTIVMATNFTERGIDKCSRYWPAQGSEGYGDMEVTLLHQTMTDAYCEATLSLRNTAGDEVRTIRHYRLTCWPSQGIPKDTKIITSFLREIKMADSQGPVIVHCSAGVGRTGVLIALDIGLQGILQGQSKMDVLRVVSTLRQDRTGCVQTRDQYRFIHQAMYDVAKELGPQKGLRPLPK